MNGTRQQALAHLDALAAALNQAGLQATPCYDFRRWYPGFTPTVEPDEPVTLAA